MKKDLKIKKKIFGPVFRKIIRPLLQKYKIRKVSLSTIREYDKLDSANLKLVGFLQIHNEKQKGNLKRVLEHMKRFCDEIVVYDDGSTDNSVDLASQYTNYIIKGTYNDFIHELEHKQKLLTLALSLNPDWIVWLDADEVFDRSGELFAIRALCHYGITNGVDGFSFQEFNLWKKPEQYRVDEQWHKLWQIRLWRNNGSLKFESESGLHHKLHPHGIDKVCSTDIKVIHYGFSSQENIVQKYDMYKKNGQSGWLLDRIIDETGIRLERFSRDWFPLSTQKVTVVCLIYKSIEYLNFVLNSFNKYTRDAELLFIANDATDRVKNYLEKNKIKHLIFENEDKSEHYIKRVYRAWNFAGMNAKGDIIVFVNSDMAFSQNWLNNLLRELTENRIVTSRLIESGKLPSAKTAIGKNFGITYKEFNDEGFQEFVKHNAKRELNKGGLFMPCAIYKDIFEKSGGYPIGNREERSGKITSGDWIFFYEKLKPLGIEHFTVCDSIVYHIQEGEMDE